MNWIRTVVAKLGLNLPIQLHSSEPVVRDGETVVETQAERQERATRSANRGAGRLQKRTGTKPGKMRGGFDPVQAAMSAIDDLELIQQALDNGTTFDEEWEKKHGGAQYFLPMGLILPFPNPDTAKSQRPFTGDRGTY
jgi:hypothetical protein